MIKLPFFSFSSRLSLDFFILFLPCPSIMKSLDSGILSKCKTNWTTGRQWTMYLRDYPYRIHRKFAQIFAKKFVKCKNLHKKLRKHLRHDYFLAFICANICTNFGVSKIFAQIFAQLFAQIFRLKNIHVIICSNFWVKRNLRKFFFANICVKFLATY